MWWAVVVPAVAVYGTVDSTLASTLTEFHGDLSPLAETNALERRRAQGVVGRAPSPAPTPRPTHLSYSTLELYVSFDGGAAADDSGNGYDGTMYGGAAATTGAFGSIGALYFDGTDDYVEFPAGATADILGSSARTVCLWAKIDAFDGGDIFGYGNNGDAYLGGEFGLRTHLSLIHI